jgi:hypothetical protein
MTGITSRLNNVKQLHVVPAAVEAWPRHSEAETAAAEASPGLLQAMRRPEHPEFSEHLKLREKAEEQA